MKNDDITSNPKPELKPCPACGGNKISLNMGCVHCECGLSGPSPDPTGAKWNAMPRREDVEQARGEFATLAAEQIAEMRDKLDQSEEKVGDLMRDRDELRREVDRLRREFLREATEHHNFKYPSPDLIAKGIPKNAVRVTSGEIENNDWLIAFDGTVTSKSIYSMCSVEEYMSVGREFAQKHNYKNQSAVYRVPKKLASATETVAGSEPSPQDHENGTPPRIDPAKTYRTRDGHAAVILGMPPNPIVPDDAVIGYVVEKDGKANAATWTIYGEHEDDDFSLIECKPRVKGWVNIYKKDKGYGVGMGGIFATKDIADKNSGGDRIACVEIDVEEGHGIGAKGGEA